jgi:hypothetical protein
MEYELHFPPPVDEDTPEHLIVSFDRDIGLDRKRYRNAELISNRDRVAIEKNM